MSRDGDTANTGTTPWRLTEHVETAVGPKLADPFVDHLDSVTHLDVAAQAEAAYVWLADAYPALHACVSLVTVQGLSLREAGRCLGLTHPTVGKYVDLGLAKVRDRYIKGDSAA